VLTGMYASVAILAALNHRGQSGRGQYIDMALLDCIVALGGNQITGYFASGKVPGRFGNAHATLVPYQVFGTADGQMVVAVGNDVQWQRYCDAIGRPDLAREERWRKVTGRIVGRDELVPDLCNTMLTRTTADWIARLEANDVPCGPINNYRQVFENPQVIHRGLRVDIPRAAGGTVSTIASPMRLQGTPVTYEQAPPTLGEHTEWWLRERMGRSQEQIDALLAAGVVQTGR